MKNKKIITVIILIIISITIIEPVIVYSYEKDIAKVSKNSWIEEEMDNNEAFVIAIEEATNKNRSEITKKDLEKIVKLTGSGASEIPRKIDDIVNLVELDFAGGKIESVPESIKNLKNLKKINLNQNNLKEFPNAVLDLPNLRDLHINKGNIKEIPAEIDKLKNTLVSFDIRFQNLVEIPNVLLEADKWIAASKETHGKGLILDITDNQISQPYNNEVNIPFSMGGNLLGESKYEKPSYGIKQDQLIYRGDEIKVPIGTNVKDIEFDIKNLGLYSGKELFKSHTFEVGVDEKSDYNSLFVDGIANVKGKTNIFIKTTQSSADNMKARAVLPVEVVSYSKPIINGANNCNIVEGNEFNPMAGVTAKDTEDGDLTKDIKVSGEVNTKKPGSYEIIYEVTDSDGNKTTVKRIVTVNPKWSEINSIPTIKGAQNKTIKISDKFNPLEGVTANDKEDGDITKNIKVIENTVDTSKAGTYKVVYEVADSKGAKTTKTISVVVRSNDKPIIAGADNISLKEGEGFDPMAGVTAKDTEDGDLTKDIKVSGEVNTKKPGSYEITYEVTDSDGNKTTVKRIVTVNPKWSEINNLPTINGAKNKIIKISDKFNPLEGVTANDKEDGDITKNIKVIENTVDTSKAGTYKVVYEVTDSKGAKTTKTIIVIVRSSDKPIIAGADNISLKEGESFNPMAGVTAKDTEDGDLTKDIKVSGEVNTKKPGSYEITYEVIDSDGNKTTVKRIVKVILKVVQINNAPIIYAKDKVLKLGDKFNEIDGVTAFDREDGDITKNIKVIENTVDTSKAGKYKIVYEVSDSKGVKTIKEVSIVVKDNDYINNNNNNKLPKTGYSSLMVLLGTITTGLGIVFLTKKK